jgi:Pyruvate/2-oxoacid:ferredoxin oxidoreductase gamma subunit
MTDADIFNILIVGVGGQGVMTLGKFFQAYALEDPKIGNMVATESRGVSQREGSVKAIVRYVLDEKHTGMAISPTLSQGSVRLLLALEPLEFLRNVHYLDPEAFVLLNTQPLIPKSSMTKKDVSYPDIQECLGKLCTQYPKIHIIARNFHQLALTQFGQSVMVNRLLLDALQENLPKVFEKALITRLIQSMFHEKKKK